MRPIPRSSQVGEVGLLTNRSQMFNGIYEHKHGNKQIMWLIPLTAFVVVSLQPSNALAFEATLASSPAATFEAPAQLAGRDPYLTQAITQLPEYSYTQAGSITDTPSPVTTIADWPATRQWTPVATFAPVVAPAAAPAPTPAVITPQDGAVLVLEGEASYYSRAGCLGCDPNVIMANGQPLNDNALTMAIGANLKHLVGHHARVTSLATGKSVTVKITDTGGFYKAKYGHRVADLTIATKLAIGIKGGVGQVRVEVF